MEINCFFFAALQWLNYEVLSFFSIFIDKVENGVKFTEFEIVKEKH